MGPADGSPKNSNRYSAKGPITTRKPCLGTQAGPCADGALVINRMRFKRCPACSKVYDRQRKMRMQTTKPCMGSLDGPCPDKAVVPNRVQFKRCEACAKAQHRHVKRMTFRSHWHQYREQRKGNALKKPKIIPPRRRALIDLALELGLGGRAA